MFTILLRIALLFFVTFAQCAGINSLNPGKFKKMNKLPVVIFQLILVIGAWGILGEIALRWLPQDLIDDESTLVQVMAWCRQATSH